MALPPLNLAPLTELDAVNNLLMSIGQSPVNSLNVPGVKDISLAQLTLFNVTREVLTSGWWFNRDVGFPLSQDATTGVVTLPSNLISCVPDDATLVERQGKLWDTANFTFTLPKGTSYTAECVWFLKFEDVPQVARNYIQMRAGRVFQANIVGSPQLYQFTEAAEAAAFIELDRANTRGKKVNMFQSAATINRIANRQ